MRFDTDIKYLHGVGPQRAELLSKELGIHTMGDLLTYYPYRYVDRSKIYRISEIDGNMPFVQVVGRILSMEDAGDGRARRIVARVSDGTGIIELVWFQRLKFIAKAYTVGKQYLIFGKPTVFNSRYSITHPDMEEYSGNLQFHAYSTGNLFEEETDENQYETVESQSLSSSPTTDTQGSSAPFRPHYHTTEKMKRSFLNSEALSRLVRNLLSLAKEPFPETLTQNITGEYHLMPYDEAIRNIHFPESANALRRAQARLKFEELFYVQLGILRYAKQRELRTNGFVFKTVGQHFNDFYHNHLPFQLTGAQKRVIREIRADMGSGRQMNRLLQGDVGSGKTLVALLCALIALDNGYQTVIMAPTEILAQQHLDTIRNFLGDMPLRVELLTGSVKGKKRTEVLDALLTGSIHILVGTHAVIEDAVQFHRLGFVVIDEQHRFGVAQRARLWNKTSQQTPHVLVMTATPIPRTLAMTLYGDLEVSVIDELPPGRKPIKTIHQYLANKEKLYGAMRNELRQGHQIYVVYPLIKESEKYSPDMQGDYSFESRDGATVLTPAMRKKQEKTDMQNLEDGYQEICRAFPEYRVGKVHGQLKPSEKDIEMEAFASNKTQILVATTVIEVGVNVPNASVMIIMNAERFGLSQLHQLRGRVGRGAEQSYCVLVSSYKLSENTRKRLQIMVDSTDGFEIAEQDLKLRGPGDIDGTQQSGMAFDLKIANIARDGQLLNLARNTARRIIDSDPDESNPDNAVLWHRLSELRSSEINWGAIS